jgi:integrase/recombinase XerD
VTERDYVAEFESNLLADGKGAKTVVSYVGDVRAFVEWLGSKGASFTGDLKRFHLTSYRKYLLEANYLPNTVNKKVNSLRAFNEFLVELGVTEGLAVDVKRDKVKVAAGSEGEVEVLTEDEVDRLLFKVQDGATFNQRDRLLVVLLLFTGLRVSEAVSLKLSDLDFLTLQLRVWGKGGKLREVPLRAEVVECAKDYMKGERRESRFATGDYLFVSQRAGRLDRDTVNKVLKRISKQVGMTLRPHKFRHTFCTRLLKKGVPITTVAKMAGHASINTTSSFYINTSRQDKLDAVNLL